MMVPPRESFKKALRFFIASCVIYVAVFVALRLIYGYQEASGAHGHRSGTIEILVYNVVRPLTWQRLLATFSILPVLALIGYRRWPVSLRGFFWIIVPVWFVIHSQVIAAESRIFLVPHAMVFVPGALLSLSRLAPTSERVLAPAPQGS